MLSCATVLAVANKKAHGLGRTSVAQGDEGHRAPVGVVTGTQMYQAALLQPAIDARDCPKGQTGKGRHEAGRRREFVPLGDAQFRAQRFQSYEDESLCGVESEIACPQERLPLGRPDALASAND